MIIKSSSLPVIVVKSIEQQQQAVEDGTAGFRHLYAYNSDVEYGAQGDSLAPLPHWPFSPTPLPPFASPNHTTSSSSIPRPAPTRPLLLRSCVFRNGSAVQGGFVSTAVNMSYTNCSFAGGEGCSLRIRLVIHAIH